jgi:hypothetical protein
VKAKIGEILVEINQQTPVSNLESNSENISIQRIIRDGLNMQKSTFDEVELKRTSPLEQIGSPLIKTVLQSFYEGDATCGLPYLGSIINAIYTEEKVTFYLTFKSAQELFKNDQRLKNPQISLFHFKLLSEKVVKGGFFRPLKLKPSDPSGIFTLIHPDLLKYFYKTMGKEILSEQKNYCLQYVRGLFDLDDNNDKNLNNDKNVNSDNIENNQSMVEAKVETLEPVKITASYKENLQTELEIFHLEKLRLQEFKERAIIAETHRLNSEGDHKATLEAVTAANEYKKQERKVLDLELNLLRKQVDRNLIYNSNQPTLAKSELAKKSIQVMEHNS